MWSEILVLSEVLMPDRILIQKSCGLFGALVAESKRVVITPLQKGAPMS